MDEDEEVKPKAKAKETSSASNSKRSFDEELEVAEETGEKKKNPPKKKKKWRCAWLDCGQLLSASARANIILSGGRTTTILSSKSTVAKWPRLLM